MKESLFFQCLKTYGCSQFSQHDYQSIQEKIHKYYDKLIINLEIRKLNLPFVCLGTYSKTFPNSRACKFLTYVLEI